MGGCFTLVESLDYSFCYSVCYQQTDFVVSLVGCVCAIVLFVNVFVLCNGTIKMLIVISEFTCPSVFYFFLPRAVTSYKHCVNISASYTCVLGVIG